MSNPTEHLTKEQATAFFAKFYGGEHHIPGHEPKPYGHGWTVKHDRGPLSTFDFSQLTTLVVMAHDLCIRVEIMAMRNDILGINIWKRKREGGMSERHPKLNDAILSTRNYYTIIEKD